MRVLCMWFLFISVIGANVAVAELREYSPNNPNTGIESYDFDEHRRWVDIKFRSSQTVYRYPRTTYGEPSIQLMIDLAQKGEGLNSFINSLPKYKKPRKQELPEVVYCGPEGGHRADGFPIKSRGQARAALAYRHWAPDPEGIKRCVCRHFEFPSCSTLINTGSGEPQ